MEAVRTPMKKKSNLNRTGSLKDEPKSVVRSTDRLRKNHVNPPNNDPFAIEKTQLSFENLDFSDTDSELRCNKKLFHTSTTEIYYKNPLERSSSSIFSTSRSSLASASFTGTSSNVTLSSTGSSTSGGNVDSNAESRQTELIPRNQRRLSSNSRFNEYIASTSSWEWEDEDNLDVPELQDPFVYRRRRRSYRNFICEDESSDLICFEDKMNEKSSKKSEEVSPRTAVASGPSEEQPSTSFAASSMIRASCPALNVHSSRLQNNELTSRIEAKTRNDAISVSTYEIAKKPQSRMGASQSSSCISTVKGASFLANIKRPITLRFAPSGLTETSRIVWMSDSGDHNGTVKWVGKIRDKFYAGIEFEKPIGNSSGIYGYGHGLQVRLFTCKLGYGRFIPVEQLILYEDFYENQKTGFICIICRDDFIEPGEVKCSVNDTQEKLMVATKCGHLFHQKCLNQWFNEKSAAFQNCPFCHFPMERNDTIRIFPAQLK